MSSSFSSATPKNRQDTASADVLKHGKSVDSSPSRNFLEQGTEQQKCPSLETPVYSLLKRINSEKKTDVEDEQNPIEDLVVSDLLPRRSTSSKTTIPSPASSRLSHSNDLARVGNIDAPASPPAVLTALMADVAKPAFSPLPVDSANTASLEPLSTNSKNFKRNINASFLAPLKPKALRLEPFLMELSAMFAKKDAAFECLNSFLLFKSKSESIDGHLRKESCESFSIAFYRFFKRGKVNHLQPMKFLLTGLLQIISKSALGEFTEAMLTTFSVKPVSKEKYQILKILLDCNAVAATSVLEQLSNLLLGFAFPLTKANCKDIFMLVQSLFSNFSRLQDDAESFVETPGDYYFKAIVSHLLHQKDKCRRYVLSFIKLTEIGYFFRKNFSFCLAVLEAHESDNQFVGSLLLGIIAYQRRLEDWMEPLVGRCASKSLIDALSSPGMVIFSPLRANVFALFLSWYTRNELNDELILNSLLSYLRNHIISDCLMLLIFPFNSAVRSFYSVLMSSSTVSNYMEFVDFFRETFYDREALVSKKMWKRARNRCLADLSSISCGNLVLSLSLLAYDFLSFALTTDDVATIFRACKRLESDRLGIPPDVIWSLFIDIMRTSIFPKLSDHLASEIIFGISREYLSLAKALQLVDCLQLKSPVLIYKFLGNLSVEAGLESLGMLPIPPEGYKPSEEVLSYLYDKLIFRSELCFSDLWVPYLVQWDRGMNHFYKSSMKAENEIVCNLKSCYQIELNESLRYWKEIVLSLDYQSGVQLLWLLECSDKSRGRFGSKGFSSLLNDVAISFMQKHLSDVACSASSGSSICWRSTELEIRWLIVNQGICARKESDPFRSWFKASLTPLLQSIDRNSLYSAFAEFYEEVTFTDHKFSVNSVTNPNIPNPFEFYSRQSSRRIVADTENRGGGNSFGDLTVAINGAVALFPILRAGRTLSSKEEQAVFSCISKFEGVITSDDVSNIDFLKACIGYLSVYHALPADYKSIVIDRINTLDFGYIAADTFRLPLFLSMLGCKSLHARAILVKVWKLSRRCRDFQCLLPFADDKDLAWLTGLGIFDYKRTDNILDQWISFKECMERIGVLVDEKAMGLLNSLSQCPKTCLLCLNSSFKSCSFLQFCNWVVSFVPACSYDSRFIRSFLPHVLSERDRLPGLSLTLKQQFSAMKSRLQKHIANFQKENSSFPVSDLLGSEYGFPHNLHLFLDPFMYIDDRDRFCERSQWKLSSFAVESRVQILHSKSRPKKLVFTFENVLSRLKMEKIFLLKRTTLTSTNRSTDIVVNRMLKLIQVLLNGSFTSPYSSGAASLKSYDIIPIGAKFILIEWIDGEFILEGSKIPSADDTRRLNRKPHTKSLYDLYVNNLKVSFDLAVRAAKRNSSKSGKMVSSEIESMKSEFLALMKPGDTLRRMIIKNHFNDVNGDGADSVAFNEKYSKSRKLKRAEISKSIIIDSFFDIQNDANCASWLQCASTDVLLMQFVNQSKHFGFYAMRERFYRFFFNFEFLSLFGGYLLGVGDRHPENILFNQQECTLMWIDLGLAFGKSLELPIPEIVPMRMTQVFSSVYTFYLGIESVGYNTYDLFIAFMAKAVTRLARAFSPHVPLFKLFATLLLSSNDDYMGAGELDDSMKLAGDFEKLDTSDYFSDLKSSCCYMEDAREPCTVGIRDPHEPGSPLELHLMNDEDYGYCEQDLSQAHQHSAVPNVSQHAQPSISGSRELDYVLNNLKHFENVQPDFFEKLVSFSVAYDNLGLMYEGWMAWL